MPIIFDHPRELLNAVGKDLGASDWLLIDQARINLFADATGDHSWTHVDPERAKTGPFGTTIAHGFLTLSLISFLMPQLIHVHTDKAGVNYGCDKIRYPAAVKVNSRVRIRGEIVQAAELTSGIQVTIRFTVEVEGGDRPACVADMITIYFII